MLPVLMYPAYRAGKLTPWGGSAMRGLFHKDIPDERTGEALELSAIPGLCSRDAQGVTLEEYIARYGEELTGTRVGRPFPLLLKLLDAKDQLSVQVHPDDAYAARVEGKLGKTEAWVILRAEPGARLVYGIRPGTTRDQLMQAALQGKAIEEYLNQVEVHAGDVYNIPAGTVHAIGKGIVLYEIQQSSDVTYRFYDWDRVDAQGKRRELHLDKAMDVTNLSFVPAPSRPSLFYQGVHGKQERLLEEPYFTLDRLTACRDMRLVPDPRRFSILTAIEDGKMLCGDKEYPMPAGQTALIPAVCGDVCLSGGYFLHAFPTVSL